MSGLLGPLYVGVLVFIISTTTKAQKQCNLVCSGSPGNTFKYETGTTYKYKLEGITQTKVSGSPNDVSKLEISAYADISALPNCVYSLKLSNVQLVGQDGKKYSNSKELESQPIKFLMNNGRVGSELCTDKDESFTSLNIKRSIISLLQSSANKDSFATQYETDVFGSCLTEINVLESANEFILKKHRDLNRCAYREGINIPFLSTGYYTESEFQSTPLLQNASLDIEQKVLSGIVKSTIAEELYEYRPTSTANSGIKVFVSTKLTLESQAKSNLVSALGMQSRTIIFEIPHQSNDISNAKIVLEALKTTCNEMDPEVGEKGASNFAKVVKALSKSTKSDILQVYSDVNDGADFINRDTAMGLFLDALFHAGSGESVEVMAELIADKKVTGSKAKLWLLSFGMVNHATKASLKAVLPLLKGEDVSSETYLGVGALAGKFCKEHSCVDVPEVAQLEAKLAAPLMAGCKPTSIDAEDLLIASLKGLGKIRYLSPNLGSKLCECASDRAVRNRVRVAALDTIQSDPKKDVVFKTASNILKNMDEDSEVRIKAYLVLVQIPNGTTAELIKDVMDDEKINQVGGFIVSHLRNLRASTNPDKADAKHHFGAIQLAQRFPFDVRKYSLNHELSYSLDSLNLGASGEANIVYSQQSYIPRSVSLNLTTQLFGHSVNLFELNARAENLDHFAEKWFGPKGRMYNENVYALYDNINSKLMNVKSKLMKGYENSIWPKEGDGTWDELESLENKLVISKEVRDEIADIDISLKTFGIEVGWFNYHSNEELPSTDSIINQLFAQLNSATKQARNINVDFKNHMTFLNAEFSYPTSLGLPMKMTTLGTSALRLKVNGKFDISSIIRNPENTDIRFQIIPSVAVDLTSTLTVDGGLVETGIKTTFNTNSATGADFTFRFLDGHGVDVRLGLPVEKQNVVTFTSETVSIVSEKGQPEHEKKIEFSVKRKDYRFCFDQLHDLIGLTFCGDISIPQEGYTMFTPSNGPSKISFRVEKEDKLSNYHFKVYYKHSKETGKRSFDLLFDTPNTDTVRTLNFQFEAGVDPNTFLKINAVSPWKKINFEGDITNEKKKKSLMVKVVIDDNQEFVLRLGTIASEEGGLRKYQPIFEYTAPENVRPGLIGRHGAKQGQSYNVSGLITVETKDSIDIINFQDMALHTPRSSYVLNGNIVKDIKLYSANLQFDYDKNNVIVKAHWDNQKENKIESFVEIVPNEFPDFGINIKWDYSQNKDDYIIYNSELTVVHGPDLNSPDSRITIKNYFSTWMDTKKLDITTKHSITYPLLGVKGVLDATLKPKVFSYTLDAKFDDNFIESQLKAMTGVKKIGDYNINFATKLMDNYVLLQCKRDIIDNDKSKLTNSLEVNPGGKYQLNAIVTHKLMEGNNHVHVDSEIKFPVDKVLRIAAGLKNNKEEYSNELKITGDKTYIDTHFNLNYKPSLSANYKFSLPGIIISDGDFSSGRGYFKGQAQLDLVKSKTKMEAKADIKMAAPKYTGVIDISWDKSDLKKSLQIKTDSLIENSEAITKNWFIIGGKKTQLNGKCKSDISRIWKSIICEAEIILPSSRHISGKYSQIFNDEAGNNELEVYTELTDIEKKGASPRNMNLKIVSKDINLAKLQFDGQVTFGYEKPDKRNLNVNVNLKKVPSGDDKWTINGEVSAGGSLLKNALLGKLESEVSDAWFTGKVSPDHGIPPVTYHLTGSLGPELNLNSNGKLSGHIVSGDVTIKTNLESVKTFKWTTNNVLDGIPRRASKLKFKSINVFNHGENKHLKLSCEINEEDEGANFKLDMESDTISKHSLNGVIHVRPSTRGTDLSRGDVSFGLAWDDKSADFTVKGEVSNDMKEGFINILGTFPDKENFEILLKNMMVLEGKGIHSEVMVNMGSKKIAGTSKIEWIKDHPVFDIVIDIPEGKSIFFMSRNKKGECHWDSELKLKWTCFGGGSFEVHTELNLSSPENFLAVIEIDSSQLNINKYLLDVRNKNGKEISINIKSGDKVIISGSTTYELTKLENLSKLVGSGSLTVNGETYPLKFTAFKQKNYVGDQEGEFDAKAGKHSLKLLYKIAPNEVLYLRSYCVDGTDCKNVKFHSKLKKPSSYEYEHNLIMFFDMSFLRGKSNDLSFKSLLKKNQSKVDHEIAFQWSPTDKIQYVYFNHENKSGISLNLPKRTIAAELAYETPKSEKLRIMKLEGSVWLDKLGSPNKKTYVFLQNNYEDHDSGMSIFNEARLSHPALPRELSVKSQLTVNDWGKWDKPLVTGYSEINIFKEPSQDIKIDLKVNRNQETNGYNGNSVFTIKSTGCKLDITFEQKLLVTKAGVNFLHKGFYVDSDGDTRQMVAKAEFNSQKLWILVKLPAVILYELNYKIDSEKDMYQIFGYNDINGTKYTETFLLQQLSKLNYQFHFSPAGGEKVLEISAEINYGGKLILTFDNKALLVLGLNLSQSDFLESDFHYNSEHFHTLYDTVVAEANNISNQAKKIFKPVIQKNIQEFEIASNCISDALPDFNPLYQDYKEQLVLIRKEMISDESLEYGLEHLKESLNFVIEKCVIVLENMEKFYTNLEKVLTENLHKLVSVIKDLMPTIQKCIETIKKTLVGLTDDLWKYSLQQGNIIIDEFNKLTPYIKDISGAIEDFGRLLATVLSNLKDSIETTVKDFFELLIEKVKELPAFDFIKEKWEELNLDAMPEEITAIVSELVIFAKNISPTNEINKLLDTITDLIEKIMTKQPFDKLEVYKNILTELIAAFKSLAAFIKSSTPEGFWKKGLFSLPSLILRIPEGSLKEGIFDGLNLFDRTSTYLLSFNLLDYIPPMSAEGVLFEGTEIITFDGQHISLMGGCSFVLVRDYKDGNFSLVADIDNGKLKSLTLADSKDTVVIRAFEKAILNGKETEYPVRSGDLKAWKRSYSVGAATKAGMFVMCRENLQACYVKVSGFYFDRLQGLMGKYNYEPYDDFTLPEGKVTTNTAEFINGWHLGTCSTKPIALAIPQLRDQTCIELFFSLFLEFLLVDPTPYLDVCERLAGAASTPEEKKSAACLVVNGYIFVCQQKGIPLISVPELCLSCNFPNDSLEYGEVLEYGEERTVTLPGKSADVVFAIEEYEPNQLVYSKLVQPLVPALTNALKQRGIIDVKFGLVGFGHVDNKYYPDYFTVDGKIGYTGETDKISFPNEPWNSSLTTQNLFDSIKEKTIDTFFGTTVPTKTYYDIKNHYPFRSNAVKTIIGIQGRPCDSTLYPIATITRVFGLALMNLEGISFNFVQKNCGITKGGERVIGYNKNSIFTLPEARKHIVGRTTDMLKGFDTCNEIVKAANGNVWFGDKFEHLGETDQAVAVDVMANQIAESLTEKVQTLKCKCGEEDNLFGKIKCLAI